MAELVQPESGPPSPSSTRILLVEDDADTAEMYAVYLSTSGYRVTTARTDDQACQAFDAVQPDVVVTDLGLPARSSGAHVIEHVVERGGGRVPVILVTGHERWSVPHSTAARVSTILVKPVLPDALEMEVRRALTRVRNTRGGAPGRLNPPPR